MKVDRSTLGRRMGLGHWEHPLIGKRVIIEGDYERVGVLRAVAPDVGKGVGTDFSRAAALPGRSALDDAEPVAWLSPEAGGREWPVPLDRIRPAP